MEIKDENGFFARNRVVIAFDPASGMNETEVKPETNQPEGGNRLELGLYFE
jgi:hypothetical protein